MEEMSFSCGKITEENLAAFRERSRLLSDARTAELSFLADRVAEHAAGLYVDGMGLYEILSLVSEGIVLADASEDDGGEGARAFFQQTYDRAIFSSLLLEKLKERGISPTESDFLPTEEVPETFTYVKNAYADEAYEVFSSEFSDPRVKYAGTFSEAVKSVLNGEVGYCLLPLAERGGVRLSSVTELLAGNDLKIASVTPVFGFSGDAELRYALVARTFRVPTVAAEDDRYLEIRCSEEDGDTLATLLCAARVFCASLYRVHTVTRRTPENGFYYTVVFRTEGKSFVGLLTYLTLYTETYIPVGIYKNLE